jgi:hypothetical protein
MYDDAMKIRSNWCYYSVTDENHLLFNAVEPAADMVCNMYGRPGHFNMSDANFMCPPNLHIYSKI